jgi:O-antigen biosynthesis protein
MISIVTATYNKLQLSRAYLASLEANPPSDSWELVWVDDGSTDGTRDWLRTLPAPQHRYIFNNSNMGFATSNNRGVQVAYGDTIALLNNDLVLTPGWWEPLYSHLSKTPNIGVTGNVQLDFNTHKVDHAGVIFNLIGTGEHHYRGSKNPPHGIGAYFPAITAACWVMHKRTFMDANGFNENYHNGCEDLDLCLRLSRKGLRHWVDFRSVIYHHVGATRGHNPNSENTRRFLNEWSSVTAKLGLEQWPRHYLRKYRQTPLKYNLTKTLDAFSRLVGLRQGPSHWAELQRSKLLAKSNLL